MWIKFLLCLCVIAFSVFLGYLASSKARARKRFFGQLYAFNEKYLNELDYARRPLSAFFAEQSKTGEFGKVLETAQTRKAELSYSFLTQEERALCADYFSMLGKGDAFSQRGYFSSRKQKLETLRNESEKQAKERVELYLKLGLLAGLAAVILIV